MFVASLPSGQFGARDGVTVAKSLKSNSKKDLSKKQRLIESMMGVLHSNCDATVAVSPKMAKSVKSFGVKPSKIHVIPNGVNKLPSTATGSKNFRIAAGISPDDIVLLYAGRLAKEKNRELLIKAFSISTSQNKKLKIIIIGVFS